MGQTQVSAQFLLNGSGAAIAKGSLLQAGVVDALFPKFCASGIQFVNNFVMFFTMSICDN
jgi:hypothetical protein